jgi:plasmid stabilization system protein ParE
VTYSLHPAATKELEDALAFYREQGGIGLARAFLAEFERVAALLVSNPGFGTPATGARRSFPLRRFPYSLLYRSTGEDIRILVVGHQHRRPGYWSGRT